MRGGHGGKGSASFRHEPFTPRGGPDGGDGGRGGSVVVEASNNVSDLSLYKQRTRWLASPGRDGGRSRKTGASAADLILKVPVGTLALDNEGALLADLDRPGARAVLAKGGIGGRGNVHFKSSTRQAPDYAEPGRKGDELEVTLDLKLIADVGFVGPPNAGKSSLLRAMTNARPKVADYPFTTLDPELGVAEVEGTRFVVADVPGLIEGAAEGAGLGQRFLRHVERTRVLVYVLNGSHAGPLHQLDVIRSEVKQFSPELLDRPHLVVVNKVDLPSVRKMRSEPHPDNLYFVSAKTGEGVPDLSAAIAKLVARAPRPALPVPVSITKLRPRQDELKVERTPAGFLLTGGRITRLFERTDLVSKAGLARFQADLDRLGINAALEAEGVKPGDKVMMAEFEFEYQP